MTPQNKLVEAFIEFIGGLSIIYLAGTFICWLFGWD